MGQFSTLLILIRKKEWHLYKCVIMKVRIHPNFNKKTRKELFGLSIKVEKGYSYCKYLIGHQAYKTIDEAVDAMAIVREQIENGAYLEYTSNVCCGANDKEYVRICIKIKEQ